MIHGPATQSFTQVREPSILVAGDDSILREMLHRTLRDAGFTTLEARKGFEVLPLYQARQPDLVLLDLPTAEMEDVCQALRRSPGAEHMPVLMITGREDTRDIRQAFQAGATDFIGKPVDPDLIVYRIRCMLRAADTIDALKKSERRLADAQRIANLGHWEWTVREGEFFLCEGILRLLGLRSAEHDHSYDSFLSRVHPDDQEKVATALLGALHQEKGFALEHRMLAADGRLMHVHNRGEVVEICGERSPRLVGTVQDITRRMKADEELTLLKEAIDCLPIGITVTDTSGRILITNPAEADLHGYTRDELLASDARLLAPAHLRRPIPRDNFQNLTYWKRESTNIRKDGTEFPVHLTSIPVRNAEGKYLGFVTACEDITERKEAETKIEELACYDALTGLSNRHVFMSNLSRAIALAERETWKVAVLFLDLDRFKDINDGLGHAFGDRLLQQVALRLTKCMRKADTVARLGGDEFVVILSNAGERKDAANSAKRILNSFAEPFTLDNRQVYTSASIGIALYPEDGENREKLLKSADAAMYHAKSHGRETYRFFSPELNRKIMERMSLEADLRTALEQEELLLHYQPQRELTSGRLVGVEALVRWIRPNRGSVEPAAIIRIAEETGLIYRLGEWVLRTACAQMKSWLDTGGEIVKMAVNISGRQFGRPDFLEMIDGTLRDTGLAPEFLELELTESVIMDKAEKTVSTLHALRRRGIQLSIDDFGTGYSSLSYLKHFPLNRIKIDRSFVKDVTTNADDAAIVDAIIAMAHRLNLKVLAEGVETVEQLHHLKSRRCDEAQGYLFSKPVAAGELPPATCSTASGAG